MWHSKAVHTCSCFLPKESPLASHIHSSYVKHHLKRKIEQKIAMRVAKEKENKLKAHEREQERQALLIQKERDFKDKIIKNFGLSYKKSKDIKSKVLPV